MGAMTVVRSLLVALLLLALVPAAALAAPPPNDARADATTIAALPSTQSATTAEATTEPVEPRSPCFCNAGSVWYRYVAATNGRLVLTLTAAGDLDATLDAYLQQRSQLTREDSDVTDAKGEASVSVRVRAGQAYLVRVAQRVGSVPGTFKLVFDAAAPEVSPPGRLLGRHGASDTLDRVLKPADAFSYRMRAGTTYRINFIGLPLPGVDEEDQPSCRAELDVYAPGTRDFADDPVRGLDCGSYVLFTPGRGGDGRYPLRVRAPSFARGAQRFHLQIAPAEASDTAPGLPLTNHQRARGALRGSGVDRVDLYRFTVTKRSLLKLAVSGTDEDLTLRLRNDRGHLVDSAEGGDISRRVRPGRYFVSVAAGPGVDTRYVLLRSSRTITSTRISLSRGGGTVRVNPAVAGTARVTVERLDPEFGWQYVRTVNVHVGGGRGSFALGATAVGRWRVRAEYLGTRDSAPSTSGFAQVLVT
jgi:hypothetical protein